MSFKRLVQYFIGDAVALDELGGAVLLDANPHETISAYCGSVIDEGKKCLFCTIVCGFIQHILGLFWHKLKTHCHDSWEAEKKMLADSVGLAGVGKGQ